MTGIEALVEGIRTKWRDYRRAAADRRDLAACDPDLVAEMASELNMSVGEFTKVVANSAGSERLMQGMMTALGVARADLDRESPALLREAEVTCARCSARKRCARELAAGTAAKNAGHFCPNADLFSLFASQ